MGQFRVSVYALLRLDFCEINKNIKVELPSFVEMDAPGFLSPGDEIQVKVVYHAGGQDKKAKIEIESNNTRLTKKVQGTGTLWFTVDEPGELTASLQTPDFSDKTVKTIHPLGVEKVPVSEIRLLKPGEKIQGDKITLYPSYPLFIRNCIESLINYPFGCAEQTSSKLYGLSIAYDYIYNKIISESDDFSLIKISDMICQGINRMKSFYHGNGSAGGFSLWESGIACPSTTAKVLQNLLPYRELPFDSVHHLIEGGTKYLLEQKYRNNALMPLHSGFFLPLHDSLKSQISVYIYSFDESLKSSALEKIKQKAIMDEKGLRWEGKYPDYWSGGPEATCDGLKALYLSGERKLTVSTLFGILERLEEGRLYSTSDTVALLQLLRIMNFNINARNIIVNGETVPLRDIVCVEGEVESLDQEVMVECEKEVEIDYLSYKGDFTFDLQISPTMLSPGDRAWLKIIPREKTLCPMAKIFLPGNLSFMKHGANIQKTYLPVIPEPGKSLNPTLEIPLMATRRGVGNLHVTLHDMYDSTKIGVKSGITIKVV